MFPTENNVENNNVENNIEYRNKSVAFDFKTGEFILDPHNNFTIVTEIENLKMWTTKILKTEKFKYSIYNDTEYGVKLMEHIYNTRSMTLQYANIQSSIANTLSSHPDIKNVGDFIFNVDNGTLKVHFIVNTKYGEINGEVNI